MRKLIKSGIRQLTVLSCLKLLTLLNDKPSQKSVCTSLSLRFFFPPLTKLNIQYNKNDSLSPCSFENVFVLFVFVVSIVSLVCCELPVLRLIKAKTRAGNKQH